MTGHVHVTFGQYQEAVAVSMRQRHGLRKGQTFYNVLRELEPELAEQLAGTAEDPYYDDSKLPDFLARVAQTLR
jgi:hypothetical protein